MAILTKIIKNFDYSTAPTTTLTTWDKNPLQAYTFEFNQNVFENITDPEYSCINILARSLVEVGVTSIIIKDNTFEVNLFNENVSLEVLKNTYRDVLMIIGLAQYFLQ